MKVKCGPYNVEMNERDVDKKVEIEGDNARRNSKEVENKPCREVVWQHWAGKDS